MPISKKVRDAATNSSFIRRMFEEGLELKERFGHDQVFDFSLGNPDLEPPSLFRESLRALLEEEGPGHHAYMPNAGYPEVRAAMAAKVSKEHGVQVTPSRVVMCVGAAGGMNVVMKSLLDPGSEVIVSRPYFVEYDSYVDNHGGVLKVVDSTEDFLIDPDAILRAVTTRTRAIILNSPNNPTGRLYPESLLIRLGELLLAHAKANGQPVYLVVDEPYRDLVYDGLSTPPVIVHYPHTIVVNSFSKSLSLPGERIGYIAVGPEAADAGELVAGLVMCNRTLGFVNAPALMQRVVSKLTETRVDITPYARRRDQLTAVLREMGVHFVKPDGAFYLFCRAPGGDDLAFINHLKSRRILCVPGTGFCMPGWFRLSYSVPDAVVDRSIPALREALRDFRPPR